MIEVKAELVEGQLLGVMEANHVSELKLAGVPMRGGRIFEGVESGSLTLSDSEGERTYTWVSEPAKRSKKWLSKRFRIRRVDTLGETWYEVQEWKWYWPVWDSWTVMAAPGVCKVIKYNSLHIAREAIRFYKRKEEPVSSIVDRM